MSTSINLAACGPTPLVEQPKRKRPEMTTADERYFNTFSRATTPRSFSTVSSCSDAPEAEVIEERIEDIELPNDAPEVGVTDDNEFDMSELPVIECNFLKLEKVGEVYKANVILLIHEDSHG
jgi:hypothetical protein